MTYRLHRPTTMHHLRVWLLLSLVTIGGSMASLSYVSAAQDIPLTTTAGSVIINEIKSGGSKVSPSEYVTLYNTTDAEISLTGWKLEFAKSTFPTASCAIGEWKAGYTSSPTGTIAPHTISQPLALSIPNDIPGSVHVVDATGVVQDLVGWGDTNTTSSACFETHQAPTLTADKSLQRYLGCLSSMPIDTGDNAADFHVSAIPTPGFAGTILAPQCVVMTPETPAIPGPQTTCEGVTLSEVLPNPASTDTGHEFIELHNPTNEVINLQGCSLQTSAGSTTYTFGDIPLQPGDYHAFYDTTTSLTLPNSSGGTVYLLSPTVELQSTSYPADPEDDTSWTFVDGMWATSYTATPNTANILVAVKPCPTGQTRNLDTNRCVTETSDSETTTAAASSGSSTLQPCAANQERNPETNRCRNIASAATASTLTPCKEGQERNPETNRCRAIGSGTTESAPCPTGQERNPDTNRCRKVTAAGSTGNDLPKVTDVASASTKQSKPYGLIAAIVLGGALCYAIYEWRQEIVRLVRNRFTMAHAEKASPSNA